MSVAKPEWLGPPGCCVHIAGGEQRRCGAPGPKGRRRPGAGRGVSQSAKTRPEDADRRQVPPGFSAPLFGR